MNNISPIPLKKRLNDGKRSSDFSKIISSYEKAREQKQQFILNKRIEKIVKRRFNRIRYFKAQNKISRYKSDLFKSRLSKDLSKTRARLIMAGKGKRYGGLSKLQQRFLDKPDEGTRLKMARLEFAKGAQARDFKWIKDTHNQGEFKGNGKVVLLYSNLNPAGKVRRLGSEYKQHLPFVGLKKPFRFDRSIILNYRVLGKLMTYFFNKADKAYDIYYDVGTHERVKSTTKDMGSVDGKQVYTKINFNRRSSVNIYNSYQDVRGQLRINPIDSSFINTNGFFSQYPSPNPGFINPIYDLHRLRKSFFRPIKGSIYQIDKINDYFAPQTNMYGLTAPHLFETFFVSSFFQSKEIEYPFQFFRAIERISHKKNEKEGKITISNSLNYTFDQQFNLKKDVKLYGLNKLLLNLNRLKIFKDHSLIAIQTHFMGVSHLYKAPVASHNPRPAFANGNLPCKILSNEFFLLNGDLPILVEDLRYLYLRYRDKHLITNKRHVLRKYKKLIL